MVQPVAIVEHCQGICRNQLVLQMQIDKQNNKCTPETKYWCRKSKENLRSACNNATRRVASNNQKRLYIRTILHRASANKATNRRRHKIDHRDKRQDNIIEKARLQIFFEPKTWGKRKRHKQGKSFKHYRNSQFHLEMMNLQTGHLRACTDFGKQETTIGDNG